MLIRAYQHLSTLAPAYLWLLVLWVILGRYFLVSINLSDSLPGRLYLIQRGAIPSLNDFAAFHYQGGGPYASGTRFLKLVKGVAGSQVTAVRYDTGFSDFYVDGYFVGRAKPLSQSGIALTPGPTGTIPPRHFYMSAPNPDSLDSRYALVGWVDEKSIIGRAIEIL
jgi:conjugal transfer pilin signal peptidase TrbI